MKDRNLTVIRDQEFSYIIYLRDSFRELAKTILETGKDFGKICVVTDSNVGPLYQKEVILQLEKICPKVTSFVFPAGEPSKNLDTVQNLYEHLIEEEFDRKDCLLALGGGVAGDLTGFAAATYLRGIDFIQVPTSLLAQVDSSIGGKTGVDFRKYKNMVGAFHQPILVYMNISTLDTLTDEEFACGMGEVLKSGLICDRDFYFWLEEKGEQIETRQCEVLAQMIERCCHIKRNIVQRDPKEKGERALLNLGHTIGHAVEKQMNFTLLHGQCVALGTVAAAVISKNRGLLTNEDLKRLQKINRIFHLPVKVRGLTVEEILTATRKDKKMEKGHVKFILMKGLGKTFIDHTVTDEELQKGIEGILDEE